MSLGTLCCSMLFTPLTWYCLPCSNWIWVVAYDIKLRSTHFREFPYVNLCRPGLLHYSLACVTQVVMCDKGEEQCMMKERCNYAHSYEELDFYRLKQVSVFPSVSTYQYVYV